MKDCACCSQKKKGKQPKWHLRGYPCIPYPSTNTWIPNRRNAKARD